MRAGRIERAGRLLHPPHALADHGRTSGHRFPMEEWMRLKTAVLIAMLVALSAGVSSAQGIWIGPTGGITFPLGDFGDLSKMGFHIGATGDYALGGGFSIGGDVVWHRSTGKDSYEKLLSAENGYPTDVTYDIVPITIHGKYNFPAATGYQPFVRAGLGVYHISQKIDAGPAGTHSSSDNNFGLNLGGGTSLRSFGAIHLDVEGAIHIISTSGSSTNLLTASVTALFGAGSK
jgi:opacity protein-like surface antigen